MKPEEYVKRLLELLDKKKKLMQDILAITEKQTASVNEDSIDMLQKLIDEKQLLIDTINKLDEDFGVYFQRLKSELKIKSLDELSASNLQGAGQLKEATSGIFELMNRVSVLEKENSAKAKKLLGQLGDEVRKINQGKKVSSAYVPPAPAAPSYFIDKKK